MQTTTAAASVGLIGLVGGWGDGAGAKSCKMEPDPDSATKTGEAEGKMGVRR